MTLWYRAPEVLMGIKSYSVPIDIWSIGCIFAEMINHRPLFAGENEIDHLHKIFYNLGTPDESSWAGVSQLPDWRDSFPRWRRKPMRDLCPSLPDDGLDILARMLEYEPSKRISALDAINHPYFDDLKRNGIVEHGMPLPTTMIDCTDPHYVARQ